MLLLFFSAVGIRRDFEVCKEEGDAKLQVVKPYLEMGERKKQQHPTNLSTISLSLHGIYYKVLTS